MAGIVLGAVAAPAPAAATGTQFSGSCDINGITTFDPPVTAVPRAGSYLIETLNGVCHGTLAGTEIRDAPVALTAAGSGNIGCSAADGEGTGTLRFTRGTATTVDDTILNFALSLGGSLTEWRLVLRGLDSGQADARLSYTNTASRHHPEQCFSLDPRLGVREVEFLMSASTLSPLISPFVRADPLVVRVRSSARRLATLRRRGLMVRVATNAPVATAIEVKLGGRSLARRELGISGALGGRVNSRVSLPRRSARLVERSRSPRLLVVVRATHASGATAKRTTRVLVRR